MSDHSPAELAQRNRELEILNAIAAALNRPVALEQILRTALAQVAELLELDTGWIFLLDGQTGHPYLAAAQNLPPGMRDRPGCFEGRCYCLDTFEAGDMAGAANVNVITCTRLKWIESGTEGLRYHSTIPLYAGEKKLGVLNVASTDWDELSADKLRLLHTVGDLLGIAIERSLLGQQVAQASVRDERFRLARELHDTLAQSVAAIAMQLETAEALAQQSVDATKMRKNVSRALDLARSTLEQARRAVLDLRAVPIEASGLFGVLDTLARNWRKQNPAKLTLRRRGRDDQLSPRLAEGLYRIANEALTNVDRHANARNVTLSLAIGAKTVRLAIRDDGVGFDVEQIPPDRFGLIGVSERSKLLGGTFELRTQPHAGTSLEVELPLRA